MSEEIEAIVDELDKADAVDLGAPLGTIPDFSYICPECAEQNVQSSTSMVSPPVTLVTRMPVYGGDGKLISAGVRTVLAAMVCENNHEHIARKKFSIVYNMGDGTGSERQSVS